LIMRKESLEELTNYGQIMDLVTDSPKHSGNALERLQWVHEPADLQDITF